MIKYINYSTENVLEFKLGELYMFKNPIDVTLTRIPEDSSGNMRLIAQSYYEKGILVDTNDTRVRVHTPKHLKINSRYMGRVCSVRVTYDWDINWSEEWFEKVSNINTQEVHYDWN